LELEKEELAKRLRDIEEVRQAELNLLARENEQLKQNATNMNETQALQEEVRRLQCCMESGNQEMARVNGHLMTSQGRVQMLEAQAKTSAEQTEETQRMQAGAFLTAVDLSQ
jgi:hypothetical protein